MNNYKQRNQTLETLGYHSYADYLASPLWTSIRRHAFHVHGKECKVCDRKATCLHHREYSENLLKGKTVEGLVPLCDGCHERIELSKGVKKRALAGANAQLDFLLEARRQPAFYAMLREGIDAAIKEARRLSKANKRREAEKSGGVPSICQSCGQSAKKNRTLCRRCEFGPKKKRKKKLRPSETPCPVHLRMPVDNGKKKILRTAGATIHHSDLKMPACGIGAQPCKPRPREIPDQSLLAPWE